MFASSYNSSQHTHHVLEVQNQAQFPSCIRLTGDSKTRGPTLAEVSYALAEINEITEGSDTFVNLVRYQCKSQSKS